MSTDIDDSTSEETHWTDARIRWPEDAEKRIPHGDDDNDCRDESALQDPFKDDNPMQSFKFCFSIRTKVGYDNASSAADCTEKVNNVDIEIKGYKDDSDEIWESTGLTVWRAAEHLCNYMTSNVDMFEGKRILELGAGLGLCGILAYLMTTNSTICMTDGDTDALACLRDNASRNRQSKQNSSTDIGQSGGGLFCHQLLWGRETSVRFLHRHSQGQTFDVLMASDIIYAICIIEPLWETVQTLLNKNGGIFVMAFARRRVPVSIDYVLESATQAGFDYQGGEVEAEPGIFIYTFRWKDQC